MRLAQQLDHFPHLYQISNKSSDSRVTYGDWRESMYRSAVTALNEQRVEQNRITNLTTAYVKHSTPTIYSDYNWH